MLDLLKQASVDGHDLANHMPQDIPYHKFSKQAFESALLKTKEFLEKIQPMVPWFRPPQGTMSK